MNTPAHVAVNLLLLGGHRKTAAQLSIVLGSVLPDAPMFWFYFYQRVVLQRSESFIWGTAYYQERWQAFFDVFNSMPILLAGVLVCWWRRSMLLGLMFASMLLHTLFDLPLHHDDGHRHFYPFSDWRYRSPLSYWDPVHHGHWVGVVEALVVLLSCVWMYRTWHNKHSRVIVALIGGIYLAYFAFAFMTWG